MIREKELLLDGALIRYRVGGNPAHETLVFLHGRPGREFHKSRVLDVLAQDYYVIAPENPGFLRSEPLKNYVNTLEQYADVAFQTVKNEGRDTKPSIVMGQSFGGIIASFFAEKYPDHTKTLILTDSVMADKHQDLLRKILRKHGKLIIRIFLRLPNKVKRF